MSLAKDNVRRTVVMAELMSEAEFTSFIKFLKANDLTIKRAFMLWVKERQNILDNMKKNEVLPEYFGYWLENKLS
jgi:hypothetical protein